MKADQISKAAMIGAGTMGAGFGLTFALQGIEARLYDINQAQLDLALKRIEQTFGLMVREGCIENGQAEAAKNLISTHTDLETALEGAPFVLEAVPEKLELKQELFPRLEQASGPEAVLASNTSSLPVSQIARDCARPDLVCGMHWFNPPDLVPLVEVVKGEKTSDATADLVYDLILRLDHVPIRVKKDAPGFIGNRMQLALFREAMHIVNEGIGDPEEVDKAVKHGIGFRWSFLGPLETADLGGLDVWHAVATQLFPNLSDAKQAPEALSALVDKGDLGAKTGRGFYDYSSGGAVNPVEMRDTFFLRQRMLYKKVIGENED
jgi:3-hydroxybutyryl-CoA dehydrogenase